MEKNKEELFELHNHLNANGLPEEIVKKIVKNIPESEEIGFAGCLERDLLEKFLKGFVLDKGGNNQPYLYDDVKYKKDIKIVCEETIKKCKEYIDKKVHIFLFPTFDKFVIEEMMGINGFSIWDNTIWIFINFKDNWKKFLKETIVHELAHSISPFYKGGDFPIGYGLILEGIAEHFKDFVLSVERSPWTQIISKKRALDIFEEIKNFLKEKDFNKYSELFYGTGKYLMWTGYAIGYYLIEEYLKKQKDIDWNIILRKNPEEILKIFMIKL